MSLTSERMRTVKNCVKPLAGADILLYLAKYLILRNVDHCSFDYGSHSNSERSTLNGKSIFILTDFAGSRKSHVVDQVERISQKREERRAAQVQERELKKKYYDPNNPMWEFAIMVKEFKCVLAPIFTSIFGIRKIDIAFTTKIVLTNGRNSSGIMATECIFSKLVPIGSILVILR